MRLQRLIFEKLYLFWHWIKHFNDWRTVRAGWWTSSHCESWTLEGIFLLFALSRLGSTFVLDKDVAFAKKLSLFILQEKPYDKDDDVIKATSFEVISTLRDVLKTSSLWRDQVQTYTQVWGYLVAFWYATYFSFGHFPPFSIVLIIVPLYCLNTMLALYCENLLQWKHILNYAWKEKKKFYLELWMSINRWEMEYQWNSCVYAIFNFCKLSYILIFNIILYLYLILVSIGSFITLEICWDENGVRFWRERRKSWFGWNASCFM